MPEACVNVLGEVESDPLTVEDHTALLPQRHPEVAIDETSQCLIVQQLREGEVPSQLVSLVLIRALLAA